MESMRKSVMVSQCVNPIQFQLKHVGPMPSTLIFLKWRVHDPKVNCDMSYIY